MSVFVAGLDGGATRTRLILANQGGDPILEVEGPASAVRPGDVERSTIAIAELLGRALSAAGMHGMRPSVLCAGVAGTGRPREKDLLLDALTRLDLADEILIETDATVAMHDAFGEGSGIMLIAGTGSIAFGRSPGGNYARCGGWGAVCGDEGSGYWIGRRALSIITAATDGREPPTSLTGAVLTAAEVNDAEALIAWAARADTAAIAALAQCVLREADTGDLRAESLLTLAAEELVLHIRTLARKLFTDERAAVPVALGGTLVSTGTPLRRRVESRLKLAVPGSQLLQKDVNGARGAVSRALQQLAVGAE